MFPSRASMWVSLAPRRRLLRARSACVTWPASRAKPVVGLRVGGADALCGSWHATEVKGVLSRDHVARRLTGLVVGSRSFLPVPPQAPGAVDRRFQDKRSRWSQRSRHTAEPLHCRAPDTGMDQMWDRSSARHPGRERPPRAARGVGFAVKTRGRSRPGCFRSCSPPGDRGGTERRPLSAICCPITRGGNDFHEGGAFHCSFMIALRSDEQGDRRRDNCDRAFCPFPRPPVYPSCRAVATREGDGDTGAAAPSARATQSPCGENRGKRRRPRRSDGWRSQVRVHRAFRKPTRRVRVAADLAESGREILHPRHCSSYRSSVCVQRSYGSTTRGAKAGAECVQARWPPFRPQIHEPGLWMSDPELDRLFPVWPLPGTTAEHQ